MSSTLSPTTRGTIVPISGLRGRNRIAETFYNGPGWQRFRRWERLFLKVQGGEARARRQILRHLKAPEIANILEVGIGDGANLPLLPKGWSAYGVDIANRPISECLGRDPLMAGRVVRAEAESLPYDNVSFDACFSIGGFNHFRDPAAALREMSRVTRPGGTLIVADEIPNLHRFGIGHLIGLPAIDAVWLGALGLDREFIQMVFHHHFDPNTLVLECWPGAVRHAIWGGLGYCFVASHN